MAKAKKIKKIRLKKSDTGRLCMVKWDDIGKQECMLVDAHCIGYPRDYPLVYSFNDQCTSFVKPDQIVELGDRVTPNALTAE